MSDSPNTHADKHDAVSVGGEPETCESCGRTFSCGAKLSACWCAQVELTEDTRDELRGRFRGCLCRECLERNAAAPAREADAS